MCWQGRPEISMPLIRKTTALSSGLLRFLVFVVIALLPHQQVTIRHQ